MKKVLLSIIAVTVLAGLSVVAFTQQGYAQDAKTLIKQGSGQAEPASGATVEKTVANTIDLLSMIVGIIAVFMIIIAGIRFITANGDSNSIAQARTIIIYAAVGLVVVAIAQTIVRFVLTETGV